MNKYRIRRNVLPGVLTSQPWLLAERADGRWLPLERFPTHLAAMLAVHPPSANNAPPG